MASNIIERSRRACAVDRPVSLSENGPDTKRDDLK